MICTIKSIVFGSIQRSQLKRICQEDAPTWYFIHSPGSGLLLLLWWSHYEYCHQGLGGASLSCSIRFECCLVHTFSLYVYRSAVTRQGWGLGLASSEPNNEKPSSIIISLLLYVASCHHSAACTGALWKTCKRVWQCWKIFLHSTWNWDTCLRTVTIWVVLTAKILRCNDYCRKVSQFQVETDY